MTTPLMRRGEVMAGAVLASLGLYIAIQASQWVILGPNGPGPGFFPLGYGCLMVLLSVVLVVRAVRARGPAQAARADQDGAQAADNKPDWQGIGAALLVWLAFVSMVPLMRYFGFVLAFAALTAFIARVIYSRPPRFCALAAVLAPLGFYLVFTLVLQVRLPVGQLTGF